MVEDIDRRTLGKCDIELSMLSREPTHCPGRGSVFPYPLSRARGSSAGTPSPYPPRAVGGGLVTLSYQGPGRVEVTSFQTGTRLCVAPTPFDGLQNNPANWVTGRDSIPRVRHRRGRATGLSNNPVAGGRASDDAQAGDDRNAPGKPEAHV